MTQSRFFQISLFFPVVLWAACLLLFSLVYKPGADFVMKNLYNTYRVFVPYPIFAAFTWKVARNKPYRLLVLMAFVIPPIWGVFFTLFYILMALIRDQLVDKWYILCFMAFWATVIAYLLEIIPYFILMIFRNDFKPDSSKQTDEASLEQSPTSPKG